MSTLGNRLLAVGLALLVVLSTVTTPVAAGLANGDGPDRSGAAGGSAGVTADRSGTAPGTAPADRSTRDGRTGEASRSATAEVSNTSDPGNTGLQPWYFYTRGVNTANGNLFRTTEDIAIRALGGDLTFVRSYNSHLSHEHGALGFGWTHNYAMRLEERSDGSVVFVDSDGSRHTFARSNGAYEAPPGVRARLRSDGNGFDLDRLDGRTLHFDADGVLQWIADRNGNRIHLEYTGGRLATIRDDTGQRLELRYTDEGRIANVTDPLNRTVEYEYETGDLVAVTGVAGRTTGFDYYENHALRGVTVPSGFRTTYTYHDDSDRVRCVDDEVGGDCLESGLLFEYDDANDTVDVRNVLGDETTTVELNDAGNPTGFTSTNRTVRLAWDDERNLIERTNETGTYTFEYGPYGNLIEMVGPGGETTGWGWRTVDTDDRYVSLLTNRTTPHGLTTRYRYDGRGNRIAEINPVGETRRMRYDARGNLVAETDFEGHETTYTYDDHGFRTSTTDPTGRTTNVTYDAAGRPVAETNPRGYTYRFVRDADGNVVKRIDPLGNVTELRYDDGGRLVSVTDATGRTVDALSRPPTTAGNYEADESGTLRSYEVDGMTVSRDIAGERVSGVTYDYGAFEREVDYRFDERGRLAAMEGPGGTTTYEHDALGRVVRVVGPSNASVEYVYDADGRRTRATYSNGVVTYYEYDDAGRTRNVTAVGPNGSVVFGHTYAYDAAGNVESVTDAGGNTTHYEYDPLDRLVGVTHPSGKTVEYTYDAVGNRLSRTVNGSDVTTYTYDETNGLVRAGDVEYEYDERGNRIERRVDGNVTRYDYGPGGRLTGVTLPDGDRVGFSYLPSGERLSKTTPDGTTYYAYASSDVVAEFHANGTLKRRYTHGPGVDDLVATERGGDRSFYHQDSRNDVRALTGPNGTTRSRHAYRPFGRPTGGTEPPSTPYGFAGRRYDEATGLYYNRLRYYDPATGRFTRPDPLGVGGGVNQYHYGSNNPLKFTDPSGLYDRWTGGCTVAGPGGPSGGSVLNINLFSSADCSGGLRNPESFQSCDIEATVTELGAFASAELGKADLRSIPLTTQGPACGSDLAGTSFWCIGPKAEAKALGGVEVGGGGCISRGGTARGWQGDAGATASLGAGAGLSVGRKITITSVDCNCVKVDKPKYRNCKQCNRDDCEEGEDCDDDPPGNDHPDDTHDPSVLSFDRSVVPPSEPEYRYGPPVAVLDRGFDEEMRAFLNGVNESTYDTVEMGVSEERLGRYDVLVVPTGGLLGLASFEPFERKLDRFVSRGGTLIVMPQQRGYQYGPVPGELRGYGWVEDQSCQFRSVGIDEYCPIVASQGDDVADINVDGYFTEYPADAEVVLTRAKNGEPSMLKYGHGNGTVIATTAYTDWASGHHAWNSEGRAVLRDAVTWARGPRNLTTYAPGENVSVSLDATSYVDLRTDRVEVRLYRPEAVFRQPCVPDCGERFRMYDPERVPPLTANASGGLAALDARNLNVEVPVPRGAQTGIWEVGYALYNDSHGEIQAVRETEQVAVSTFESSAGGYQRFDSNVKLSLASDAENYARGSNATFTITARNEGDASETVTLWWSFPHNHRGDPGDDALYGASTTRPAGRNSALNRTLAIPAGGERTITYRVPVSARFDRLWLQAHRGTNQSGEYLGRTSRGFFTFRPGVDVNVSTDSDRYGWGENATVDVAMRGEGLETATVRTVVLRPDNSLVAVRSSTVGFDGNASGAVRANASQEISLDAEPQEGHYVVTTEALDPSGDRVGYDSTTFEVPYELRVTPTLPTTVRGTNRVEFVVENAGTAAVSNATLDVGLVAPSGTTVWNDSASLDVPDDATGRVAFENVTVDTARFGTYELRYAIEYGTERFTRTRRIRNDVVATGGFDAPRYRQRENASATVSLVNDGRMAFDTNVTLSVPDAGYAETRSLALAPGERAERSYTLELPADIAAGTHEAVVSVGTTTPATRTFDFAVPESDLDVGVERGPFAPNGNVTLTVRNTGGVDTTADCVVAFLDPQGRDSAGDGLRETVRAGGTVTTDLAVPDQAIAGTYFVGVSCTDANTGATTDLTRTVDVGGLSADVAAGTDDEVYQSGENVTVTVNVSNHEDAVENGTLHVEITDPSVRSDDGASGSAASLGTDATTDREADDGPDRPSSVTETLPRSGDDTAPPSASREEAASDDTADTTRSGAAGATVARDTRSAAGRRSSTSQWSSTEEVDADRTTVDASSTASVTAATAGIDNATVWRDRTVTTNGSLVVNASGNLTLVNTTLRFDPAEDVGIGIEIRDGGTLRLVGNSTVRAVDFTHYYFQARENSTLLVRDSTVRDVGSWPTTRETEGLYVATSDATIENATFRENVDALVLDGVTGVRVVDSAFPEDSGEIYVRDSSGVRLEDNSIGDQGVHLHRSDSNAVVGNEFTEGDGFGVRLENASDNEVRANRFEGIEGIELRTEYSSGGSHRNRIEDNRMTIESLRGIVVRPRANDTVVRNNRINASYDEYRLHNSAIVVEGARARVVGNDVTGAEQHGIAVRGPNATLRNNSVSGSRVHGVLLERTTNATLRNNTLRDDSFHVEGASGDDRYYRHDVDTSNTVHGGPLYYLTDERDRTVRNDGGAVWLVDARNVTVRGTGSVSTAHSEGVTVRDVTATDRYFGVFAVYSNRTTVRNVTATNGSYGAVVLGAGGIRASVGNVVADGEFSANDGEGVRFRWVNDSVVRDSEVVNGTGDLSQNAVSLSGSNITVARNDVSGYAQPRDPALLVEGRNHTVTDNTVRNNEGIGIEVDYLYRAVGRRSWERNHVVTDNVVSRNGETNIDIGALERAVVADNVVSDGRAGIEVDDESSDVEVRGNDVTGHRWVGIDVGGDGAEVRDNVVSDNDDEGIRVSDTNFRDRVESVTVAGNTGTNNTVGIGVDIGRDVVLTDNAVSGTEVDLHMEDTRNATLRNNTLGEHGLRIRYDREVADFEHDIDASNTIGGDPLYYLVGVDGATVPADGGEVWLVNSTNVTAHGGGGATLVGSENATVRNLTVTNRTYGIRLLKTNHSTVTNATVTGGEHGVLLASSVGNELEGVVQSNASAAGIRVRGGGDDYDAPDRSSDGNALRNVTARDNDDEGLLIGSDGNTLRNVTARNNTDNGAVVEGSRNDLVAVTATGNGYAGVSVESDAVGNGLRNLTARNNSERRFGEAPGIFVRGSGHLVTNSTATGNRYGIRVSAANTTVRNITARNNRVGVYLFYAENVTVADSRLTRNGGGATVDATQNSTLTGNVIVDNEYRGVAVDGEFGSGGLTVGVLVYDNYFDNPGASEEAYRGVRTENVSWNVTKRPADGGNVIGGPFLGGNFWADYEGRDTDEDGLGDTDLPYDASGELVDGDYHPLVEERDRGKVLWETDVRVDVAAGTTDTLTFEVPGAAVAGSGKRKLSSRLNTSTDQVLATQDPSFYVFDGNTSLTLEPDEPVYATGDRATVSGVLTNDGPASRTYTLSVRRNGTEIHGESVTLAPGEDHTYAVNTTADGPFRLTAAAGNVSVGEVVEVADPQVEATVTTPTRVDRDPFAVGVELENTGRVAADLAVELRPGNDTWSVTLEPGETRLLRANRSVREDTVYTVELSGDVDRSLTEGVAFAENATVTTSPEAVYAPGTVEVPYTVENTDALPTEFTATFAVGDRTRERAVYLPAGNTTNGSVTFDLPAGTHGLAVDWPFGNTTRTLTVAEPDRIELNATVPATPTNGTLRTTVDLSNVGSNAVNGTLRADSPVVDASRGFDLAPGENATVALVLSVPEGTTPGRYDLAVSAESGGEVLAEGTSAFETTGPVFEFVSRPDLGTYGLGETIQVNATVVNTGTAGGQVALNATTPGIAETAETAWLGAGERKRMTATVRLPDDLEAGSYDLFYGLDGADRRTSLDVAGAKVDVEASLDEPGYTENDTATLTLNVTNERDIDLSPFVRVTFNDNETVRSFDLDGSETETVRVRVPIEFGGDEKVFYGVYADTGRSLYISGAYPHRARPNVTVSTDRQIYEPGDTATVTVETDREGRVALSAPGGFGWRRTVNGTARASFTVPALGSGTYYLHYSFGNESYSYPFDVDGYGVQVRDARLDQGRYGAGDTVGLSLELVPTRNVSGTATATVLDTNGTAVAETRTPVALETRRNEVTLASTLPDEANGPYLVRYRLNASVDDRTVLDAQGVKYFEVEGTESNATNRAPIPLANVSPTDPTAGERVTFDAGASRDPDGTVAGYEWDFDGDGVYDDTGVRVTHTFAAAGDYAVTLRVTDGDGATNTTTETVRVAAPTATPTPTPTPGDGGGDSGGGGGGGQPGGGADGEVEVTDATLLNDSVAAGTPVVVAVDLRNVDPARGRLALTLAADGSSVTERTVAVGASSERTVHLRYAFGSPGTYALAVNGESVGTVRVTAAAAPTPTPTGTAVPTATATATPTTATATPTGTPTSGPTTVPPTSPTSSTPTSGDGPGFGPVATLLALLAFLGVARLRRR